MTHPVPAVSALLIGGPTLHLAYGGLSILTDPTFDPPGEYAGRATLHKLTGPAVPASALGVIDLVLLSHDQHVDNLDRTGRALLGDVPLVLSTPAAAERIDGVIALPTWTSHRIAMSGGGEAEVTAVPALHGPEGSEPLVGDVTGFILRSPGLPTVYISGDNASVAHVTDIADRHRDIAIAILFAGAANVGYFGDGDLTLNARTAVQAAHALGDALIVPVHAEGWAHFSETRERLAREFGYAGLAERLLLPAPGVRFALA